MPTSKRTTRRKSTPKVAKLEVPARLYDQALRFCNARLKAKGKRPIKRLPAGEPDNAMSCPCSNACGVAVGRLCWYDSKRDLDTLSNARGDSPTAFVKFFDNNAPIRGNVLPVRIAARKAVQS